MEMTGILKKVFRNERGYVIVNVEDFRFELGKVSDERLAELQSWVERKVHLVGQSEWRRYNGKSFPVRRALTIRLAEAD